MKKLIITVCLIIAVGIGIATASADPPAQISLLISDGNSESVTIVLSMADPIHSQNLNDKQKSAIKTFLAKNLKFIVLTRQLENNGSNKADAYVLSEQNAVKEYLSAILSSGSNTTLKWNGHIEYFMPN